MVRQPVVSFAVLLRRLRAGAGLTQEELAQTAQLSSRSVSDLERGINLTARRETTRLLADALKLTGAARAEFEAAARGRVAGDAAASSAGSGGSGGGLAAVRTLPRDVSSFVGRAAELEQMIIAARNSAAADGVVGIWAISGMAGVGKTVFAIHAAHRLAQDFPDGQIFLALHGHTPGQKAVDPADALAGLLLTAGVPAQQVPSGLEARSRLWRDRLAGQRLLLVLDDAAGHEQVRPLLPGTAGSLVLITSRRHLTALQDVATISLDVLSSDDAAALLIRLADRPDISAGEAAVAEITRQCGYLPLAIGMLARQLHHRPAWTTGRLAADLAAARSRLEFMHAENLSVAAAFDLSYADLTGWQQRLFRRVGLHPGAEIDAYAAAALGGASVAAARRGLGDLYDQHLLTEPTMGRYRLHDLIREHAQGLAARDLAEDNEAARCRLFDYYLHTARVAGIFLERRPPAGPVPALGVVPAEQPDLRARRDAVGWLEAERLNLHAVVGGADAGGAADGADAGRLEYASAIAATIHGFLRAHNHWGQALTMHHLALGAARRRRELAEARAGAGAGAGAEAGVDGARAMADEARAMADLGDTLYLLLDYPAAFEHFTQALGLYRELGDRLGEASVLSSLAVVWQHTGDHRTAAATQEESLRLYRSIGHRLGEAAALNRLARTRFATCEYEAAADCQDQALRLYREAGDRLGEAYALAGIAEVHNVRGDLVAAAKTLSDALGLYRQLGNSLGEANALTTLGLIQHSTGDFPAAIGTLNRALELYRQLGSALGEANALINLSGVYQATGDYPAAAQALPRALTICRELGRASAGGSGPPRPGRPAAGHAYSGRGAGQL